MTKHLVKVVAPVHNGSSKTVVYIIYGALALILSITIFAFNNAEYAKNKTTDLECRATQNATNIVAMQETNKQLLEAVREINRKVDRLSERIK